MKTLPEVYISPGLKEPELADESEVDVDCRLDMPLIEQHAGVQFEKTFRIDKYNSIRYVIELAQYPTEPVRGYSVQQAITYDVSAWRKLKQASIEYTPAGSGARASLDVLALAPEGYDAYTHLPGHPDGGVELCSDRVINVLGQLAVPRTFLEIGRAVGEANRRESHPDEYAIETSPKRLLFARNGQVLAHKIDSQMHGWGFILDALQSALPTEGEAVYNRDTLAEIIQQDRERLIEEANQKLKHPIKETWRRIMDAMRLAVTNRVRIRYEKPYDPEADADGR